MQFMFYFNSDLVLITYIIKISVADPKRLDLDPDPAFHFDLDPDPDPVRIRIRSRIRNKICPSLNVNLKKI